MNPTPITSHGEEVEDRARLVAARLGLADFVYRADLVQLGGGATREPGDAILFANGRGAIVQVKSRDPDVVANDSVDKAQRWSISMALRRTDKEPERAANCSPVGRRVDQCERFPCGLHTCQQRTTRRPRLCSTWTWAQWPIIIVLDHPNVDRVLAPDPAEAFWITLDDWFELNRGDPIDYRAPRLRPPCPRSQPNAEVDTRR